MARFAQARLLSFALLLLTLVAGILVGMAVKGNQSPGASPEEEAAATGERDSRAGRRLVIDQVGLDSVSRAEVGEIIRHFRIQVRALEAEFEEAYAPRQSALFQSALDSIKSLLTPEQKSLYDSLLAVRERERSGRDNQGEGRRRDRPEERQ